MSFDKLIAGASVYTYDMASNPPSGRPGAADKQQGEETIKSTKPAAAWTHRETEMVTKEPPTTSGPQRRQNIGPGHRPRRQITYCLPTYCRRPSSSSAVRARRDYGHQLGQRRRGRNKAAMEPQRQRHQRQHRF